MTVAATTDLGQIKLDACGTVSGTVANPDRLASPAMAKVVVFNDDDPDLVTRSVTVAAPVLVAVGVLVVAGLALLLARRRHAS